MSARLGALRWMSSDAVSAFFEVKDLAPALSNLLYDPVVPERSLNQLLDWAEIAADPGFDVRLRTARSFGMRCRRSSPPLSPATAIGWSVTRTRTGNPTGLSLHDTGNGAVVGRIMMLITEVIAPVHGDEGRDLAHESRSDLARNLHRIIEMIGDQ